MVFEIAHINPMEGDVILIKFYNNLVYIPNNNVKVVIIVVVFSNTI